MDELRDLPYSIKQGEIIKAIVRAKNSNGWSEWSDSRGEGALMEYPPMNMT